MLNIRNNKHLTNKEFSMLGNARHYKTPYRASWKRCEDCAKKKNIYFDLTYNEFLKFVEEKTCHYCNCDILWIPFGKKAKRYNLDRKDNSKGYTKDNLVVCCWKCNDLKGNKISYDDFYALGQILLKDKHKDHWLIENLPNKFMSMNEFDY